MNTYKQNYSTELVLGVDARLWMNLANNWHNNLK